MKQTNVSIFIPHVGCPYRCSFCDQRSISGTVTPPRGSDVSRILEEQAGHLSEMGMKAEIAFFGGSFTAVPRGYMTELLEAAKSAMEKYPVYNGIRCSTRPDCISEEILGLLKSCGVTAIELGAQSMSDEVLAANDRGHTAEDVRKASRLIKAYGIELGLQMMTGLYRDSVENVRYTAREFISLAPKTVRVYPTVILDGTRLGELYKNGEYRSFTFEQTVDICAELLELFEKNNIAVIRMGLHASADVEREMLGGVYHPAFREICESRLFLNELVRELSALPKGNYTVYTDVKNISKVTGQRRGNIAALAEMGYKIKVREQAGTHLAVVPEIRG